MLASRRPSIQTSRTARLPLKTIVERKPATRLGNANNRAFLSYERFAACAQKALISAALAGTCLFGSIGNTGMAAFADFSPEQELVAEAWKVTDNYFVDRTFAGEDWFMLRQKMVKQKYADRSDAYNEIETMLKKLGDKYTRFLTPAKYGAIYSTMTGSESYAGVGIELIAVDAKDGSPASTRINSIFEGSMAGEAGLREGDVLLDADGQSLIGLEPDEVAAKVRGLIGTKVRLSIKRAGEDQPQAFVIERKALSTKGSKTRASMESVSGKKVGYVQIKQFVLSTADDVKAALESLKGAQAYVFDLRGNLGGYLPASIDVARLFLKAETPITYVVDKTGQTTTYSTFTDGAYVDAPLIILVNENTASASEVLSSCLQDNDRATIVGAKPRTFGKGVIQTIEPLSDGSGISLTIAKYLTPKKNIINMRGVDADVVRECPQGAAAVSCVEPELKAKLSL